MASAADEALQTLVDKLEADGDCEGLVALMQLYGSSDDVQVGVCRALATLCLQETAAAAATNVGAIEAVVAAMQRQTASRSVQHAGCCALYSILNSQPEKAVPSGAIEAAVAAMQANRSCFRTQQAGCEALAVMVTDALARRHAGNAGAIEAVVAALRAHIDVADLQTRACWALSELVVSLPENVRRVFSCGGFNAVIAGMQAHYAFVDMQQLGCRAVVNVLESRAHADERLLLGSAVATAMQTVAAAMLAHRTAMPLLNIGSSALYVITVSAPISVLGQACGASAVEAVITAMHADPAHAVTSIHSEGCTTLCLLASASTNQRATAVAAGALDAVVLAMRAFPANADLQLRGCAVLGHLACNATEHRIKARAAGAVEQVISAMQLHERVHAKGCRALCLLSMNARYCVEELAGCLLQFTLESVDAGAAISVEAVSAASFNAIVATIAHAGSAQFPANAPPMLEACLALWLMSHSADSAACAGEVGAVAALVAVLRSWRHNTRVLEAASLALTELVLRSADNSFKALRADGIQVVGAAMRAFPAATTLQ